MAVYLVEVTTVEQLVEKLKKGKYKSANDVRAKSKFAVMIQISQSLIPVTSDTDRRL